MAEPRRETADVCIAGAGPAGLVLGLLLAKQGLSVLVLEQQKDFEREYRGEVLMPRFVQAFRQVNLWDLAESQPHLKLEALELQSQSSILFQVRFREIAPEVPFAVWMPQPVLLRALCARASQLPGFRIHFGAFVKSVLKEGEDIRGVLYENSAGEKIEVSASVTVGADGRASIIRTRGGFELESDDYPLDIAWFTVKKPEGYENAVRFLITNGKNYVVLPKHPDSIQFGMVLKAGGLSEFKNKGIEAMRAELLQAHPLLESFARGLTDFKPFHVLQARSHYVREWAKSGCLLIGDAAHTCSPAGAIGVSVAVTTAIVAAQVIADAFKSKDFSKQALGRVQALCAQDVKEIQGIQRRVGSFLAAGSFRARFLISAVLPIIGKTDLLRRMMRGLIFMRRPLPAGPHIRA